MTIKVKGFLTQYTRISLSWLHESQPIPFDNNLEGSTGGLKRPGLVRPLNEVLIKR
jgi:hypothetical protein